MLLLVSGFVGLFFVAAVQQGDPATGKVSTTTLLAVLKDPLTLFAERSPGGRAEGALLSVKPGGPQERVLSTIRERDPTGTLPGVGDPVVAGVPEGPGPGGAGPEESVLPGESGGLPGSGGGGAPGGFGGPGFARGPGGLIPEAPPGEGIPGDPGAPGPGPGDPDPDPNPGLPPGPGAPPPGIFDPGASPVPEPATWAMLILGFFAIGAAIRRRKRDALPCAR